MAEPNERDREVRGRVAYHIHRGELNAANGAIADYREEIEQTLLMRGLGGGIGSGSFSS